MSRVKEAGLGYSFKQGNLEVLPKNAAFDQRPEPSRKTVVKPTGAAVLVCPGNSRKAPWLEQKERLQELTENRITESLTGPEKGMTSTDLRQSELEKRLTVGHILPRRSLATE